jgi:hypothetical protein
MNKKIMAMITDKQQRKQFLKEFLVFALQEQNKYIAINDPKEIKLLYKENLEGLNHWVMQNIPSARQFTRKDWKH